MSTDSKPKRTQVHAYLLFFFFPCFGIRSLQRYRQTCAPQGGTGHCAPGASRRCAPAAQRDIVNSLYSRGNDLSTTPPAPASTRGGTQCPRRQLQAHRPGLRDDAAPTLWTSAANAASPGVHRVVHALQCDVLPLQCHEPGRLWAAALHCPRGTPVIASH